jgi:hypothetical protein
VIPAVGLRLTNAASITAPNLKMLVALSCATRLVKG